MKSRLTLILFPLVVGLTACPDENPPPSKDAGVTDSGTTHPQLVIDPDPTTLSFVEGQGPVTFTITLTEDPRRSITALMTSTDPSVLTIEPAEATLGRDNFATGVTVTLTPQDDDDANNELVDIKVETDVGSATYTLTIVDDDSPNLVVTPGSVTMSEGGTATVDVRLSAAPDGPVAVAVASGDTSRLTLSDATLTFEPQSWDVVQTVTLTARDDNDIAANTVDVTFDNPAGEGATVPVTINDNDSQGLRVSTSSITVGEAGSATVAVSLTAEPSGDVTVSIVSSDPGVAQVGTATLTFTPQNWNMPQDVIVFGVDDPNISDDTAVLTVTSPDVGASVLVGVTVVDDDTQTIEVTTATVTVGENATATFGVRLGFVPAGDVVVSLAASDAAQIQVAPPSLTFTPADWDVVQFVDVAGQDDADAMNGSATIVLSAPGAGDVTVSVTVVDDDTLTLLADMGSLTVGEGGSASVGVRLSAQPGGDVTVSATSVGGAFATSPGTLTFTPVDWDTVQTLTIDGVQDQDVADESDTLELAAAGLTTVSIPVTVLDDDVQAIVTGSPAIVVPENGSATFDVTLAFQPSADVTVDLTPADAFIGVNPTAIVFTPADWNTPHTVTVAALDDQNTTDEQSSVVLSSGGLSDVSVQVTVTDDDSQAIVLDTNALALAENGAGVFTARLAFQPSAAVALSIESSDAGAASVAPTVLMFDAGDWDSPQSVTVLGTDDADVMNENVMVTVSGTGLTPAIVAVTVADDDTQALVVDRTAVSLGEGASDMVNVSLAFQPAANVTVSVASADPAVTAGPAMLTFTPANYDTPQPVVLAAVQDQNLQNETVSVTITSFGLTPVTVTVSVTDDDTQALVVSPTVLSVNEGGSDDVSISLAFQPASPVTVSITSQNPAAATPSVAMLTFTSANYATPQIVSISGVQDADVTDETADVIVASAGLTSVTVSVTVVDDDVLNLNVNPTSLALTEGGAAGSFNVSLTQQPAGPVSVAITPSDPGDVTLGAASLSFDGNNWNVAQAVSVTPNADNDALNEALTLTVSSAGLTSRIVSVTIADDDTQALVVSAATLALNEGSSGSVTVALAFNPVNPATVTITSGDSGAVVANPTTLTFTSANYSTPQAVMLSAVQDADTRNETVNVQITSAVAPTQAVTVSVTDDDVQALVLTTNTVALTEGASQVVGVSLAFDPVNPVTVTAASSDAGAASATPASFTFTSANYSVAQSLTVAGVQDNDTANENATITVQTSVAPSQTISVSVTDDDTQVITLSRTAITMNEGGTATFTARLGFDPVTPVTVSVATSNPAAATAAPVSLSFTTGNWSVPQTVTVMAPQDDDTQNGSATITLSSAVAANRTVAITVNDDDTQSIVVSSNSLVVAENSSGSFTVRLAFNPLSQVTVNLANSDAGALSVVPATLTFDAGNYSMPQSVAVNGLDDNDTLDENVTVTLSGGGAPANTAVAVTVNDDDVQALVLSQTSVTVAEGATDASVTVRLAYNPVNAATVTVTSLDPGAATGTPATLTFTAGNFSTPQTLTITGVQDQDLANEAVTIRLSSAIANSVDVSVSVTDDDTQALVVTPLSLTVPEGGTQTFSVRLAFIPGANVTVGVASNDALVATAAPASLPFTAATWDQPQTVTVSGSQDIDLVDDGTTIDVTSAGVASQSVAVNVTDDDTQTFVINPTSLSLTEGGAAGTFAVSLQFMPSGPVTVSLASSDAGAASVAPASLSFDGNDFSTPQTVTVTPVTDVDTRDENVTITVSSVSVPVAGMVAVTVSDDDVQALVVTPTSLTVTEEGAPGQFAVSFAFAPNASTTVSITSTDPGAAAVSPATLTFTPGNYNVPQTVNVTGVSDQDVVSEMVNIDVTTAVAPGELVVVTVTDDDTQAIVVSANQVSVTEGQSAPFTARLAFQPQSDTTVTLVSTDPTVATTTPTSLVFTSANWSMPQTVMANGVSDADQLDESTTVTLSSAGLADQVVTVDVTDDDDQAIVLSANTLAIDEEQTGTFTVRLAFIPTAPSETVTLVSSDVGAATVSPASIVFTAANYATPVTVSVHGETDEDILDETVTITLASDVAPTPNRTVTVDVNDIDIQDIVVSAATLALTEGGSAGTVTVRLSQDPSGSQTVTVTSPDPAAVSAAPATLTFNSGNYTAAQTVTFTPQDDDDVRDESVAVQFTSPSVTTQVTTVTVADDDTQAILTQAFPVTVLEGGSDGFNVVLAFRPTNPITVTVTLADPTIASVSPSSLVFDSTNFDTVQRVTVDGSQDADLDDESSQLTLSTGAVPPPEGAAEVTLQLDVIDDDQQVIIANSVPTTLPTSVQEGGPGVTFQVSLGFPPRLSEGGTDTVVITSTLATLSFNPSSIVFGQGDFDTPVAVTVTAADDTNTVRELVDVDLSIVEEVSATHPIQVIDDEETILASTTYPGLTGGTLFTKRQNVRWGATRLAVLGFDGSTGDTVIGSNTRELDDAVTGPALGSGGGGTLSAESIEFDGTDFRYFFSSSNGIDYAASDETAASTLLNQNVAGTTSFNFWPAWNGSTAFGLVYREDGAVSDRLRFRVVQLDGTASSPTALTIVDGSDDVQPNAHFTGSGYTIIYSSASEVRCVRTNAAGALIPGSDTALAGFPAGGAFVSTVWDGSNIVAAYYEATNSIDVVRITPSCTISGTHHAVGGSNVFLSSPPSIDWNGTEFAVAYDYLDNNVESVGVLLVTPSLTFRDDYPVGLGSRPSITWAGDRWALRYGNPVAIAVGSFQTLCADGIQDQDEADVDCGGSLCQACPP